MQKNLYLNKLNIDFNKKGLAFYNSDVLLKLYSANQKTNQHVSVFQNDETFDFGFGDLGVNDT